MHITKGGNSSIMGRVPSGFLFLEVYLIKWRPEKINFLPKIAFNMKICPPNIDERGHVCLPVIV